MPLDSSASPGESPTSRRANGIFGENLRQRFCELVIKGRYIGAATHGLIITKTEPTPRRPLAYSTLFHPSAITKWLSDAPLA